MNFSMQLETSVTVSIDLLKYIQCKNMEDYKAIHYYEECIKTRQGPLRKMFIDPTTLPPMKTPPPVIHLYTRILNLVSFFYCLYFQLDLSTCIDTFFLYYIPPEEEVTTADLKLFFLLKWIMLRIEIDKLQDNITSPKILINKMFPKSIEAYPMKRKDACRLKPFIRLHRQEVTRDYHDYLSCPLNLEKMKPRLLNFIVHKYHTLSSSPIYMDTLAAPKKPLHVQLGNYKKRIDPKSVFDEDANARILTEEDTTIGFEREERAQEVSHEAFMTNKKRKREVERKKPVIKKKKVEVRIEDVSGEISYSSGLVYEKQTATTSMVDSSGDTVMTEITSVGELNVEQNERQSMERIVTESVVRENEKNSESVMEEEIPIREGNNGKESIDDAVEGQDKQELVDNTWGTLSTSNEDSSFSDDEEDNINEVEYLEKTIAQTYHNEPDELEEEEEEEEESRALLTDKQVEQTEQSNKSEQLDKEGERTEPRNKEGESLEQTITEGEPLEKPEEGNKSAKSPRNRRVQKVRRIAKEDDKDDEEEAEKRRRTSLKELKNAEIYNAILSDRSQRQSYPLPSERKPRRPQKRRKEAVPWTAEEVEALEVGILSYKGPYWASIRDFVKPRLDNRTNVQIKDKARNELKKRQRENLPLDCYGCLLRSGDSPKS